MRGRPKGFKITQEHKLRISEAVQAAHARKARAALSAQRAAARGASVSTAPAFVGRDLMVKRARRAISDLQELLLMLGEKK